MSEHTTDAEGPASTETLRTPIVAVLGHVDHGKTSLLDEIRGSAVTDGEAGAITQHIGATAVPLETVAAVAGSLVDPTDFDLPGLLFIDTPGHQSFTTLRARGGALADIAILVVDVTDGFQPQTVEAIDILARTETPFVVAANKIDTIPGWRPHPEEPIQADYESQSDRVRGDLDDGLYDIIGSLSEHDFSADLYWRVQDFGTNVGVVPVSAETGEGVPDLLAVLMGLSQRYMREDMTIDASGPGAGTVLEVSDEKGYGTTLDVVLYDGTVEIGDQLVVGGHDGPIVTEVRALLQPRPNAEIRTGDRFERVDRVSAAAGIKIAAPDLDDAIAGAPVRVLRERTEDAVLEEVASELADIAVTTGEQGVVLKADTLGSLEAMANALEEAEVPIVRAEVGAIAPRDVAVAETAAEDVHRAILGFGVDVHDAAANDAEEADVEILTDEVIYRLVEAYEERVERIEDAQQEAVLENIVRPARIQLLPDHTFRQSDPAVVGVELLGGTLHRNVTLCRFEGGEPERVGTVNGIQHEGEDVETAEYGDRVSVAIDGPTVGRQIEEGDRLWVEIPEKHAKALEQELRSDLPAHEVEVLDAYLDEHRQRDPFWGK